MLKIGITGGIGSGKSTVCKLFSLLGVPVYSADLRARFLMDNDSKIREILTREIDPLLYTEGKLDRKRLASLIFDNKERLHLVNGTVHPVVAADFQAWCSRQSRAPYILHEAAIIFESGLASHFDKVIVVDAPRELRIKRVMERDGVSREAVMARIKNQLSDRERRRRADYLIHNDNLRPVIRQVLKLHTRLQGYGT